MDVGSRLAELRGAFPGCRVILFADLSAGLALAASADRRPPQERLDTMCAAALKAFDTAGPVPDTIGDQGPVLDIVAADADTLILLARSETHPEDALICECSHDVDLAGLMSRTRRTLLEIADAG